MLLRMLRRNGLGLRLGRMRLSGIAVKIGNRGGRFRRRYWSQFIRDRSNQTILGTAATAAPAATPATAGPPLATRLVGAKLAGLFVNVVLVGFAVALNGSAGFNTGSNAGNIILIARGPAFARLSAAAASPPPAFAFAPIGVGLDAVAALAGRLIVGEAFGLFGLDFGFDLE